MDTFVSSHNGRYNKAGNNRSADIKNSYEIWKDKDDNMFVKMKVMHAGKEMFTLFDYDDLDKILNLKTTLYMHQGYARTGNKCLHHVIMNFKYNKNIDITIDHINRDRADNRKKNLRHATRKQQLENQKGKIEGTKRARQIIAIPLPEEITQEMIPKYVSYRKEKYKEYFIIEEHPVYVNGIMINGQHIGKHIKSIQAQWIDQYANPKIPYPITKKLDEIRSKTDKLDEIYKLWLNDKTTKNITINEDQIIKELISELRIAKNTKKIYKYDETNNLIEEYDSIVNTFKANNCSENSIRRAVKSGKLFQGYYYKTEKI